MASWDGDLAAAEAMSFPFDRGGSQDSTDEGWCGSVVTGRCPLFDDEPYGRDKSEALLVAGAAFINDGLGRGGSVYVHCQHGSSRSASVVICFLMIHRGMSLLEAMERVKRCRPKAGPNDGFIDTMLSIERKTRTSVGEGTSSKSAVVAVARRKFLDDVKAGRIELHPVNRVPVGRIR